MARTPRTPKNARAHEAQLVAIESLKPYKANPRRGDVSAIRESLRVNGQYRPVVVRARTREVLAGNHTLMAAQAEGWQELWATFVDCDAATAKRIVLVDNRTNDLAGYDDQALADLLGELPGVEGTGWSERELVQFVASVNGSAGEDTQPGGVPEEPRTKSGDLWVLGEHRLLCGDATVDTDVSRLMGGGKAGVFVGDPPYGVALRLESNHEASNSAKGIKTAYRHFAPIVGDDKSGPELQAFLEACFTAALPAMNQDAAWYLWHAQMTQGYFAAAAAAADLLIHRQIIWAKPHFIFGRGDYHWQHELCFYGWRTGSRPPWYGERNQSTLWTLGEGGGSIRRDQNHPTQKPVELFEIPLRNHTKAGEGILDPFAGSGTSIIAAENLKRRCYAMEIDPGYCDVIVDRWERHTGLKAKHG